jgi:hypothetical protein
MEFSRNVVDVADEAGPSVVCSVDSLRHSVGFGWFTTSLMTAFTINLLGFPIGSHTTEVWLAVDVLNADGVSVGVFNSRGKATAYGAMYWGYNFVGVAGGGSYDFPVARASLLKALRQAMKPLKDKIGKDAAAINTRLRNESISPER